MLLLFIGGYFIVAARTEARGVFKMSVATRLSVALFLAAFVATGQSTINLLLFAPPDALLALWRLLALRADVRSARTRRRRRWNDQRALDSLSRRVPVL